MHPALHQLRAGCLRLVAQVDGARVTTIEGVGASGGAASRVQAAFLEHGGAQCGICTPGMILAVTSLLDQNPHPSEDDVRVALAGNLCRCTGYTRILEAVRRAAEGP